jgi:hypothetical protein
VKVSAETRAALRAGAAMEGMDEPAFARRVVDLGLAVWRRQPPVAKRWKRFQGLGPRIVYRGLEGRIVPIKLSVSASVRKAGAAAEGVRLSDFARRVVDLGLAVWRGRRGRSSPYPAGG